jgi:hypothetical protein
MTGFVVSAFRLTGDRSGEKDHEEKSYSQDYTASDIKLLKAHSKARRPVSKPAKLMKRSEKAH